ncbi:dephospho-CoA kinase [Candidatus Pelagibacter bacterium]|jgi:dephospho-CoA kinase|nr:dephospho-CoA kinase [Candidatus Pelagibacter bacterium]
MIKIGITGSLASGKTTASQILSYGRGPLFSADEVVKKLYKNKDFKKLLSTKFSIKNDNFIKKNLRKIILGNNKNIEKLEKIIHPQVRIDMKKFTKKNKNRKMLFYEIPLLIESNLMRYFNIIIFVKAKRNFRLKRFKLKNGDLKLFNLLDKKQLNDNKKIKFCDYVVVNEKNLKILKKKLLDIISKYE